MDSFSRSPRVMLYWQYSIYTILSPKDRAMSLSTETLMIFAGAGASKAVGPDRYPTTVEFFDALPSEVTSQPHFQHVDAFLRQSTGEQSLDIELVLWSLKELKEFCQASLDPQQLAGWMIQNGRFNSFGSNANIGSFRDIATANISQLDQLISQINKKVYDLYAQLPEQEALQKTWIPLLKGCATLAPRTEIITTNYDMIIESALDLEHVADNGWRGSVYRTLDTSLWSNPQSADTKGLLTKLHGSVNWSKQDQTIYVGDPTFKGQHENHAIIYPGFKGRPNEPLFLSFHEHLRRVVRSSRVAIFIGFAFRDPYINEIIASAITARTVCIVINPVRVQLPFDSPTTYYLESGFSEESVSKAIAHARDALSGA